MVLVLKLCLISSHVLLNNVFENCTPLLFSKKKKIELRKPEKSNWQSCFLKFKPLNCNIRGRPLLHWGTILHLRRQASHLLCFKVKAALQSCRKLTYEAGDKCGKLLARVLRVKGTASYIPHIQKTDKQKVCLPKDIARKFGDFYSSLYNLSTSLPQLSKHTSLRRTFPPRSAEN